MSQRVVRVAPLQAAKMCGVLYFIIALITLPFIALPMLLANQQQPSAIALVILMPLLYAVVAFLGTAFLSWLYNLVASRLGGIELELSEQAES